jgi:dipeptidyl aminopeptidase/acylaminoacyl peptidase
MGICLPDNNPFLDSFPAGGDPVYGLARVDINGDNYRDLPALNTVQAPDWGVDGITYASTQSIEITTDTPGQDGTRQVVSKPFYQDPSWQPAGDRIVFQSKEGTHWEIFAAHADGSDLVALTRPASVLVDAFPHNVAPAWSPDGRTIVFLSNRDAQGAAGSWGLWVMGADGGNQRPLSVPVTLDYTFGSEQIVSWGL